MRYLKNVKTMAVEVRDMFSGALHGERGRDSWANFANYVGWRIENLIPDLLA